MHHQTAALLRHIVGFALLSCVCAADDRHHEGIWANVEVGIASIDARAYDTNYQDENFYLGFNVGYAVSQDFLASLEFSGYTYEPSNYDPNHLYEGEGISQVFAALRYYPCEQYRWFAKLAGGYVSHWDNNLGDERRRTGTGYSLGIGYDLPSDSDLSITPFLNYNHSSLDHEKIDAFIFGIGIGIY